MSDAIDAREILTLAQSRNPADRERLLLSLVDLCAQSGDGKAGEGESAFDPRIQPLMDSVFMALVSEAEREIRKALSEKLSDAAWAPHGLINVLAMDEIEIARPVIAQSPVLEDKDLVRVLAMATIEHQIEVANRPAISEGIVGAILRQGDPSVMTALAGNDTAEIGPDAMKRLLDASRQFASMRSPLVRHPRLTSDMAQQLYAWVGQSLRSAIVSRFRVDPVELDRAIAGAVTAAQPSGKDTPANRAPVWTATTSGSVEQREAETRLVQKLAQSGQLRPGYLIKALRDQRLGLFIAALAQLVKVQREHIEMAISGDRPELLALACTAAGVDRSAYPTILQLVRDLNRGLPAGGSEAGRRAMLAFDASDPDLARRALRQATTV